MEAGAGEFGLEGLRREEELEGFTGSGDAAGEGVEGGAADGAEGLRGEGVVKAEGGAGRELGDGDERGLECAEGEIGNDAEPAEESGLGGVEALPGKALGEGLVFKVEGHKGEVGGQGDGGGVKHFALALLGGGKIDLEDMEGGKGVAIGEGVESGAEDDVLRDAGGDGLGEAVFNIAAADGHEGAKVARDLVHGAVHIALKTGAQQGDGDGVFEDAGMVNELVGGTADGHAQSCFAGLAGLHRVEFTAERMDAKRARGA